jgi:hypothetical protein
MRDRGAISQALACNDFPILCSLGVLIRVTTEEAAMPDQIIDAVMARGLHADARRTRSLVGWVVVQDPPAYPDKVIARLVTEAPSPYLLMANSLAEMHAQLPPGLVRIERQAADPPEVVEIWFPA